MITESITADMGSLQSRDTARRRKAALARAPLPSWGAAATGSIAHRGARAQPSALGQRRKLNSAGLSGPCRQREGLTPAARGLDIEPEPERIAHVFGPVIMGRGRREVVVIEKGRSARYRGESTLCAFAQSAENGSGRGTPAFVQEQAPQEPGLGQVGLLSRDLGAQPPLRHPDRAPRSGE